MKYNELVTAKTRNTRRLGRGISAGQGKTAGRGTKGQNARAGGGVRPGFEGGQNPLMQRLPKLRGFRSIRPKAEIILTGQLDSLGAAVTNEAAFEAGLVTTPFCKVKVVGGGEVSKKHTVQLQAASGSAIKAIEKAGGSFNAVEIPKRPKTAAPEKTDKK